MGVRASVGGLGAYVKYHCLFSFLILFGFIHHAHRSPRLTDFGDFDNLYVENSKYAFLRNEVSFSDLSYKKIIYTPFLAQNSKICITAHGDC